MLTIEKTEINGLEVAIRGMRNPKNSWDKSDSRHEITDEYVIGEKDMKLMKTLVQSGSDHRKFMRFITVSFDIVAPLYWWKEFDTYKVGTVANSCSTMHKIMDKEFEINDFSHERLNKSSSVMLQDLIDMLNSYRSAWKSNGFVEEWQKKEIWWQIIQLLPTSYNQRRTVLLNYEVLRNMYHARKDHKLDEWHTFCRWIESLPYSELIIC